MVRGGRGGTSNSGKAKRPPKAKAKKALGKKRGSVVKTHGGGGKAKAKAAPARAASDPAQRCKGDKALKRRRGVAQLPGGTQALKEEKLAAAERKQNAAERKTERALGVSAMVE